jgi:hypothetical protein
MDQFWQTLRPIRKVGKLRGILTIPTFSQEITPNQTCLAASKISAANDLYAEGAGLGEVSTLTIEFQAKVQSYYTCHLPSLWNILGTLASLRIESAGNILNVYVINGSGGGTIFNIPRPYNEWFHCAVTYDATDGLKVYIDGELVDSDFAGGGVITVAPRRLYMSHPVDGSYPYEVAELRVWDVVRTADEIRYYHDKLINSGTSGLVSYWRFNEEVAETIAEDLAANGYDMTLETGWAFFEDYPIGIKKGVSFVIGRFVIEAGKTYSMNFPVRKPYPTVNFMPVIRWLDSETDTIIRYRLWDLDGVDIAPIPPIYTGQAIPDGASLEIWNVDGNENVELTETFDIETSILNVVTSPETTTQTESATMTALDTSIFQDLPLPLPSDFDQPFVNA